MYEDVWTNNKHGNEYVRVGAAIDTTNEGDGRSMVVYFERSVGRSILFVREEKEFLQKFTQVERTE
jgi:hypothetical protein